MGAVTLAKAKKLAKLPAIIGIITGIVAILVFVFMIFLAAALVKALLCAFFGTPRCR
jgi:hypothetical protein